MIRVYADFNARTLDGDCFILYYEGIELENCIERLGLTKGSRITLHQDDMGPFSSFDVEAVLTYGYVEQLQREAWTAKPDNSTLKYHSSKN
jgi:hypothetical protein